MFQFLIPALSSDFLSLKLSGVSGAKVQSVFIVSISDLRYINLKMKAKTIYWLEIAQYDLDTSTVLQNGERFLYVAFCCHQAIEKILKAL